MRQKNRDGILIRSKARWIEVSEKLSKYFCNLENRNYISKNIKEIEKNNSEIISNTDDIIEEA